MGGWAQVGATILVNLIGAAFIYGSLVRGHKEHERRLDAVEEADKDQWVAISHTRVELGKVKGKLGMNGA